MCLDKAPLTAFWCSSKLDAVPHPCPIPLAPSGSTWCEWDHDSSALLRTLEDGGVSHDLLLDTRAEHVASLIQEFQGRRLLLQQEMPRAQ